MIFLDFETFSGVDLRKHGLSRYARHDSTDVICMAYAVDNGLVQLWRPGEPVPHQIVREIENGRHVVAHNAAFERDIWEFLLVPFYRFPPIPPKQWLCTAAASAYANLPRSLEKAAKALAIEGGKDMAGRQAMLWLCRPRATTLPVPADEMAAYEAVLKAFKQQRKGAAPTKPKGQKTQARRCEPDKLTVLYEYCKTDTAVERDIYKLVPKLSSRERAVWELDQKINHRGAPVDLALCRGAVKLLKAAQVEINAELCELSSGRIKTASQRDAVLNELRRYEPFVPDIQAKTLEEWGFEDATAARIAHLRRSAGSAAVKKMQATLDWAGLDGRCRHTLSYYAAGTGRWGGRGPQFQNMKRGPAPSCETIDAITSGDYDLAKSVAPGGDVTNMIAGATRAIVCAPPGRALVQSDFAAIELRVLNWLAGQDDAIEKLYAGADMYVDLAARIYGEAPATISKEKRQIGKAAALGLGYGMSAAKFAIYCRQAGQDITDEFAAGVVEIYRSTHPKIVRFWRAAQDTIVAAIRDDHQRPVAWSAGHRRPAIIAQVEGEWLTVKLPSQRKLYYHKPEIDIDRFGKPSFFYSAKFTRKNCYGAMAVENFVQATARDLLADALLRLEQESMYTVLHIHDSTFVEVHEDDTDAPQLVHRIMEEVPGWATGCPLRSETITARRMK